jgi:hypothetical protein
VALSLGFQALDQASPFSRSLPVGIPPAMQLPNHMKQTSVSEAALKQLAHFRLIDLVVTVP